MPKRLSTEEVKATFERYGYTVPANFVYKNNITHYRVYDQLNNDYIDMTYKMLMYQVKNKNRQIMPADNDEDLLMNIGLSENGPRNRDGFIDLMNMQLSQNETRVRDGFIDLMNMPLSENGPRARDGFYNLMNAPLSDEEAPQSRLERYSKKFGKLFMKETDKFKNGVMKMSNKIIKKLMHGQPFTLKAEPDKELRFFINDDKNSIDYMVKILYALSHAMKIAAPKINKDIIMTIVDKKGHTQYARVNQNTIDMLDWVLEDKEYEINDSGDPILESLSNFKSIAFDFRNISKGKRIVGAFFPYYWVSHFCVESKYIPTTNHL